MTEEEKKAKKPAAKKATAEKAEKAESKPAAKKVAAPKREKKTDTGIAKQGKLVADLRLYDVIQRPLITEKSTAAAEHNKVVFQISADATKVDVKKAVEALFGVKVLKVNTLVVKGKTKRFKGRPGQRSDVRKAVVTLVQGHSIDLAAGLR